MKISYYSLSTTDSLSGDGPITLDKSCYERIRDSKNPHAIGIAMEQFYCPNGENVFLTARVFEDLKPYLIERSGSAVPIRPTIELTGSAVSAKLTTPVNGQPIRLDKTHPCE